jgi:UDP-N-acetylmuramoylalanine--D-glutamate ligase
MPAAAVLGLAVTGRAVTEAFRRRGFDVAVADDSPSPAHAEFAAATGARLVDVSSDRGIDSLLAGADVLVPAPGVPPHSRVIRRAAETGVPVRSEIDIAHDWESARPAGARPVLGITGTDGKTTTTMLTAALLRGGGLRAEEVGNTDIPFMAAVDDPAVDVFVVECSSFRLQFTETFRCDASTWLNLAPDHLDWHPDLGHYAAAKEKIWAHVRPGDVAVVPHGNDLIAGAAARTVARVVTFGLDGGDYRVESGHLVGPSGALCDVGAMWRSMPHDITNSLAAAALVLETGLVPAGTVAGSLASFSPAHHRIEYVGTHGGSRWFDDSKATSPHAALTAIRAFDRIVLIAGGRNKGLDLTGMASEPGRMHAVVAMGDDAALVEEAFHGVCPVRTAGSMEEAVALAAGLAEPGVDVLLSPGCTSYDWYRNYNERGDDYQRSIRRHFGEEEAR